MRRSLAFLAVLPLLPKLPEGYVPSKEFGYDVETRCNTCNQHFCQCPAPEKKCEHKWKEAGFEGPYWCYECELCGAEKSHP